MDIKCVVCGEPWDSYGVEHGDMEWWQAQLFRAGAGCPSCEGQPSRMWEAKGIGDFENGDEDEFNRIVAYENRDNRPEWKRPNPEVLWACASCGVEIVTNPDENPKSPDAVEYRVPRDSKADNWYHSHPFGRSVYSCRSREPHHTFLAGTPQAWHVCDFCYHTCENCGKPIAPFMEGLDTYDEGNAFPADEGSMRPNYLCIDCFEQLCSSCGEVGEDCDCVHCECCGEPTRREECECRECDGLKEWTCDCGHEHDGNHADDCPWLAEDDE